MPLKTRKLAAGRYSIEGTELVVELGQAAKFGNPQEWEIVHRDEPERPLLTAKGRQVAIEHLQTLLAACFPRSIVVDADQLTADQVDELRKRTSGRLVPFPAEASVDQVRGWIASAPLDELQLAAEAVRDRIAVIRAELGMAPRETVQ